MNENRNNNGAGGGIGFCGLERQPGETDLELKQRVAFFKQEERRAGRR